MKRSLLLRLSKLIVAFATVSLFSCAAMLEVAMAQSVSANQLGSTVQIDDTGEAEALPAPLERKTAEAARSDRLDWWHEEVVQSVTESERWVSFDLETVLLDTLENSPRIESVSKRTSIAFEQIVQQDAMFDPNVLFESRVGRNNEPIGNELTTGGPPRLIEGSTLAKAGVQKTGRRGTLLDLSQEVGTFNSNSRFVTPLDQGNARLAVSLTQPLLGRGGRVYNERLVTQANIDSRISWQEMRSEVEVRVSEVINAYWRLYELRCHLLQQTELLQRGEHIQQVVLARRDFDTGRVELAKTRQRVARRIDRLLQIEAGIAKQQARLASLIGSELLQGESGGIEFVPEESPQFPRLDVNLSDALLKGIENRPEVRAAVNDLKAAGLEVNVTRAELDPELSAIVAGFVGGLDGNYGVFDAWTNQFTRGGPGVSAAVKYQMPYGRRAARARYREAQLRYQQRNQQLREAMQLTTADIETALIDVNTALAQQSTKKQVLVTAIEEENILTKRWEMMGDEGGLLGVVLENLLDAQQRRTEAEREWSSAQVRYLTSIVALQKAMGTLLVHEGIRPIKHGRCAIQFVQDVVVNDEDGFISPSDITPGVESEVDAEIEADVKPELEKDLKKRQSQGASGAPMDLPMNLPAQVPTEGVQSQNVAWHLPVGEAAFAPMSSIGSRRLNFPSSSGQQKSNSNEGLNVATSVLGAPVVSGASSDQLRSGNGSAQPRGLPGIFEPVPVVNSQSLPVRSAQRSTDPYTSVDQPAFAASVSLGTPTSNRVKVIRLPRPDNVPQKLTKESVPASLPRQEFYSYPGGDSLKSPVWRELHLELQR